MNGFLDSFKPILQKYKIEVFLITASLIIVLISLTIFIKNNQTASETEDTSDTEVVKSVNYKIFADIAGAVAKPDVYEVTAGARLKHVILLAGGLSEDADRTYFARNFNLARLVGDQEKIYIPSTWEINSGIFIESPRTLDYVLPAEVPSNETKAGSPVYPNQQTTLININSATLAELDQLPGIGKILAQKIISNRPYSTIEDLLNKKVINKSVFEKIKSQISIY